MHRSTFLPQEHWKTAEPCNDELFAFLLTRGIQAYYGRTTSTSNDVPVNDDDHPER